MNIFSNIIFDKKKHIYTLDGQRLPSVTSYVNKLKVPFDADYWSNRKAKERGVSPETILAEWDEKRRRSQEKGTQVHEYIEGLLLGKEQGDDPFLALNSRLPEMDAFDQLWERVGDDLSIRQVEWAIGDAQLCVAGTVDAVFYSHQTELYHVWDWKTNSKFRTNNRFQMLLSPFDDLDECEFTNYSLQSSIYRLIVERNTDYKMGDSYLVHLMGNEYKIHKALDLRAKAEEWLSGLEA